MVTGDDIHYNMTRIPLTIFIVQTSINAIVSADKVSTFHSRETKEGHFASPEYPYSFQSLQNMTYKFVAEPEERVQIIFDEFKLSDPNEACSQRNAYLTYKRDDGKSIHLCGLEKPLPILSDKHTFILEFKQPLRTQYFINQIQEENKGFNATYRFTKNLGVDSGRQEKPGDCEFFYDSADALHGTFQSPNFNGHYPENMDCYYFFRGNEQYLKINFTEFNLLGSARCSEVYGSDYLELTETADRSSGSFYERHCGQLDSFNRTVNGSAFNIIFRSSVDPVRDSKFSTNRPFIGFRAFYEFTNYTSNAISIQPNGQVFSFVLSYSSTLYIFILIAFSFI